MQRQTDKDSSQDNLLYMGKNHTENGGHRVHQFQIVALRYCWGEIQLGLSAIHHKITAEKNIEVYTCIRLSCIKVIAYYCYYPVVN